MLAFHFLEFGCLAALTLWLIDVGINCSARNVATFTPESLRSAGLQAKTVIPNALVRNLLLFFRRIPNSRFLTRAFGMTQGCTLRDKRGLVELNDSRASSYESLNSLFAVCAINKNTNSSTSARFRAFLIQKARGY